MINDNSGHRINDSLEWLKEAWHENWPRFKANKVGLFGFAVLLVFLIFALLGPLWITVMGPEYEPVSGIDLSLGINPETNSYAWPPSLQHPFGTDSKGSDIFSQFLNGAELAFLIGLSIAMVSVVVGTLAGIVAGYWGGKWVDSLIMRVADILICIPLIPLLIVIGAIAGALSLTSFILIMSIFSWSGTCRVVRSQVLSLRTRPYVDSARVAGASNLRIMFRHIAPNVLPLAFYEMTMIVGAAILTEASVSFLGFGDPTQMSWGMMLQFCRATGHTYKAIWWLLPPGLGIAFLSASFYMIGRAFDEIVNPRLRERR